MQLCSVLLLPLAQRTRTRPLLLYPPSPRQLAPPTPPPPTHTCTQATRLIVSHMAKEPFTIALWPLAAMGLQVANAYSRWLDAGLVGYAVNAGGGGHGGLGWRSVVVEGGSSSLPWMRRRPPRQLVVRSAPTQATLPPCILILHPPSHPIARRLTHPPARPPLPLPPPPAVVLAGYLHYVVSLINEICAYLKIPCLTIRKVD